MKRVIDRLIALSRIDRRVIYVVMLLVVALPFVTPVRFRAKASEETLRFDRALDAAIASDAPVIVSLDFGPQTQAELEPIFLAVLHKLFFHKKKVILLNFIVEASALARQYLHEMEQEYDLTYGEDYAYLGLATPYYIAIYAMGTSIEDFFHEDDRGTPLSEIPLMQKVRKLGDAAAVIDVASPNLPHHWVNFGVTPYKIDLLVGATAVKATDYYPYLQAEQIKGLIAGGRAGAELEGLIKDQGVRPEFGSATTSLASQSLALLAIIVFIVIGNVGYFVGRTRRQGRGR